MQKININDIVLVKLSDEGKQYLVNWHKKFYSKHKINRNYQLPKEDENGYSKWQIWELMGMFGEKFMQHASSPLPFDIEIYLDN